MTEALFENIGKRIVLEINEARNSIFIAVAWFTNLDIFNALLKKEKEGCQINLMYSDDDINNNSSLKFDLLKTKNSNVYPIGDGSNNIMHNKFCVIDESTVITGSYNWSNKAESNHENITISKEAKDLAQCFISEFNRIKKLHHPESDIKSHEFHLDEIIKRLEIIKNFILLGEIDAVKQITSKLNDFSFNHSLKEILNLLELKDFDFALLKIDLFISESKQIVFWTDPEIDILKMKIRVLEEQINAFDNEKSDIQKLINDFNIRHARELGLIILDILQLRIKLSRYDKTRYQQAEADEKKYKKQYHSQKAKSFVELNDEDRIKLKKVYRKATTLCHPDKFSNESIDIQERAELIFKQLNEANSHNNLSLVLEIYRNLQKGYLKLEKGKISSDQEVLNSVISSLTNKLIKLEFEIKAIKESEIYKSIILINNWDDYFEQLKQKLLIELDELKKDLNGFEKVF